MDKIKVLHIINGGDRGGIQSVILNYYKYIDRAKFQFDFVIPQGQSGPIVPEFEKLGSTFYELPPKGKKPFAFIRELRHLIKSNHYDIVHAHHHSSSYFPLLVALFCGVKCRVAQSHSFMVNESVVTKIKRYVGIVLNDFSSNLRFACTEDAASHLFGSKFRRFFPVTILPNGVEPENFQFSEKARSLAREEFNIDNSTLVFGIVARMTPEKNQRFLIDVLAEMQKIKRDVKLLFVGDGPQRGELNNYAMQMNVASNTIFAGQRQDLLNMLCAMDVFTLPSLYEGSPVSAVEAAANGLPLVLSARITRDLQFLSNVEYVDLGNRYEEWAKIIIDLSTKGRDVKAISNINEHGFNVKSIAKLLADSYLSKIKQ